MKNTLERPVYIYILSIKEIKLMMRVGKYIARDHESARYGMESESVERLRAYIWCSWWMKIAVIHRCIVICFAGVERRDIQPALTASMLVGEVRNRDRDKEYDA